MSWAWSAGSRRPGGSATAGRWTRSPPASLPVFIGRATRLVDTTSARQQYRATICFGERSTTDDIDGERTQVPGPPVGREAVAAGLVGLTGPIRQVPPAYSAVQVAGRRAYQLARSGEAVELAPRDVTIHRLELVDWDERDPARPVAVVDVECSAGTYIRALARDLGERLGSGAFLGALVRTASGGFRLDDALAFDALRARAADGPAGVAAVLRPVDAGLEDRPRAGHRRRDPPARGPDHRPETPLAVRDAPVVLAVAPMAGSRPVPGRLRRAPSRKVLVERARRRDRSGRCDVDVVAGLDRSTLPGPVFVVVGVFDGLHLGPRTCSASWSPRRGLAGPGPW
jgi:tRNA pseudouridine(55) synthase